MCLARTGTSVLVAQPGGFTCLSSIHPQAECSVGAKAGLLSYPCRVNGKTQCWCPNIDDSDFNVDTNCQVMWTPAIDGFTARVGELAMHRVVSLAASLRAEGMPAACLAYPPVAGSHPCTYAAAALQEPTPTHTARCARAVANIHCAGCCMIQATVFLPLSVTSTN